MHAKRQRPLTRCSLDSRIDFFYILDWTDGLPGRQLSVGSLAMRWSALFSFLLQSTILDAPLALHTRFKAMFPSFKLTLLAALLLPAVTNASPHNAARFNPHSDISLRGEGHVNLHRRFTNARMTFYNVQTGNEYVRPNLRV